MSAPDADGEARRAAATLRRAGFAGGVVGVALVAAGIATALQVGAGGAAAGVLAMFGVVAGLLVISAWLLAAVIVDLISGRRPARRVLVATAVAVVATFLAPILVVGASAAAPGAATGG